jgi:hypothetical protein
VQEAFGAARCWIFAKEIAALMASYSSPIVVLDSGLGGLTVVRELQTALPDRNALRRSDHHIFASIATQACGHRLQHGDRFGATGASGPISDASNQRRC